MSLFSNRTYHVFCKQGTLYLLGFSPFIWCRDAYRDFDGLGRLVVLLEGLGGQNKYTFIVLRAYII